MRFRKTALLAAAALFVAALAACNSYGLRYQAQPQPAGVNLFADYVSLDKSIAVEVDTDSLPLENIYIKKADGTIVRPLDVVNPTPESTGAMGAGAGLGVEHDATNNVANGTGLAVPAPPTRTRGLTTATFANADIGPGPWELHVKVQGEPEAVIPGLGGKTIAK
jgi:hypothetical protein